MLRDEEVLNRIKEIRELFQEFGLTLSGYDPGVTAYLKDKPQIRGDGWGGEPISFDQVTWEWLEPLLKELKLFRRFAICPDKSLISRWLKVQESNKLLIKGPF